MHVYDVLYLHTQIHYIYLYIYIYMLILTRDMLLHLPSAGNFFGTGEKGSARAFLPEEV